MTGAFDTDAERNPYRVNALNGPEHPEPVTDTDIAHDQTFRAAWIAAGQRKAWDPEQRCWWTVSLNRDQGR